MQYSLTAYTTHGLPNQIDRNDRWPHKRNVLHLYCKLVNKLRRRMVAGPDREVRGTGRGRVHRGGEEVRPDLPPRLVVHLEAARHQETARRRRRPQIMQNPYLLWFELNSLMNDSKSGQQCTRAGEISKVLISHSMFPGMVVILWWIKLLCYVQHPLSTRFSNLDLVRLLNRAVGHYLLVVDLGSDEFNIFHHLFFTWYFYNRSNLSFFSVTTVTNHVLRAMPVSHSWFS